MITKFGIFRNFLYKIKKFLYLFTCKLGGKINGAAIKCVAQIENNKKTARSIIRREKLGSFREWARIEPEAIKKIKKWKISICILFISPNSIKMPKCLNSEPFISVFFDRNEYEPFLKLKTLYQRQKFPKWGIGIWFIPALSQNQSKNKGPTWLVLEEIW